MPIKSNSLPLLYTTPDTWVMEAFKNPLTLLNDHAYLERKAATNALDLLNHWPEGRCPKHWIANLTSVAKDETVHLSQVTKFLQKKGGQLDRRHRSPYASDLRKLVRMGKGPHELLDRLLISALIEARSCERFGLLARLCPDAELKTFYATLYASELGHYTLFHSLALDVADSEEFENRWRELLDLEAKIIQKQPVGSFIHGSAPA